MQGAVTTDHWDFRSGDGVESIRVVRRFSGIGLTVKTAALAGMGVARFAHSWCARK
ncbi:MAG: hypothetical protein HC850_16110 [Rhodomicrobium sp.]|nr:hypothetical protein [Rhodomicrobium sp.]